MSTPTPTKHLEVLGRLRDRLINDEKRLEGRTMPEESKALEALKLKAAQQIDALNFAIKQLKKS